MSSEWTQARIIAEIKRILRESHETNIDDMPETATIKEIGIDSMQVLDVVMDLEDLLHTRLTDIALPRNCTLGDLADIVVRNLAPA